MPDRARTGPYPDKPGKVPLAKGIRCKGLLAKSLLSKGLPPMEARPRKQKQKVKKEGGLRNLPLMMISIIWTVN